MNPTRVVIHSQNPRDVIRAISTLAELGFETSAAASETEAVSKYAEGMCQILIVYLPTTKDIDDPWAVVILRPGMQHDLAIVTPSSQLISAISIKRESIDLVKQRAVVYRDTTIEALLNRSKESFAFEHDVANTGQLLVPLLTNIGNKFEAEAHILLVDSSETATLRGSSLPNQVLTPLLELIAQQVSKNLSELILGPDVGVPAELKQIASDLQQKSILASLIGPIGNKVGMLILLRSNGSRFSKVDILQINARKPLLQLSLLYEDLLEKLKDESTAASSYRGYLQSREQELRALNGLLLSVQAKLSELEEKSLAYQERMKATLKAMSNLVLNRDMSAANAAEQILEWLKLLAGGSRISDEYLVEMAYLHDIGMPTQKSDFAQVDEKFKDAVMKHPYVAEQVAQHMGLPLNVVLSVKHHHENYDGSGFPDRLKGENIPIGARLLRLVDDLVNLMSVPNRSITASEALVNLNIGAGRQYDPVLLSVLSQLVSTSSENDSAELISTASHELRSPLTFLKGYSELLADDDTLPQDARQKVRELHNEAIHMSKLVEDLLSTSSYESKRIEFKWRKLNICDLLKSSVQKVTISDKRHVFRLELPPEPIEVQADGDKLIQVLDNLLDNAIKYSPNGGSITASATLSGDSVRIDIADQGIGIPSELQNRVFLKFERLESPLKDTVSGTGLGLYLCKRIIEEHRGKIWLKSEPGNGTVVSFTIPVERQRV